LASVVTRSHSVPFLPRVKIEPKPYGATIFLAHEPPYWAAVSPSRCNPCLKTLKTFETANTPNPFGSYGENVRARGKNQFKSKNQLKNPNLRHHNKKEGVPAKIRRAVQISSGIQILQTAS